MSKNPAIMVKIKHGEHPEEIAAKLSQVPNSFWISNVKRFNLEDGQVDVLVFVHYPEMSVEDLLDHNYTCSFDSKIIE